MILRLYAWLLRLYPRGFYERFGSEMLEVFQQAQNTNRQSLITKATFYTREFIGLLISISRERWSERGKTTLMARKLFRWYLIPFWLFGFSLIVILIFSWSYWGYIVKPSTIFQAITTVDSISLVQFDDDYFPTALPLNELPYLISPSFPPSQILPYLSGSQTPLKALPTVLAERVSNALASERIDLGRNVEYPSQPVIGVDGCNQCFQAGLQLQADGTFLETYPDLEALSLGQPQRKYETARVTPNEYYYYSYILPAAYLVMGKGSDGTPLIFVGLATGVIGGERLHYYEYLFDASSNILITRNQLDYRFDVPGLLAVDAFEDFNTPVMTFILFTPLFVVYLIVLLLKVLFSAVRSLTAKGPLMGQG